jgi:hypothetical protein
MLPDRHARIALVTYYGLEGFGTLQLDSDEGDEQVGQYILAELCTDIQSNQQTYFYRALKEQ